MPVASRFGTRPPAPEKVVQALAAQNGEVVAPHGAREANALGLTQQVPIREVYLSAGPGSRKIGAATGCAVPFGFIVIGLRFVGVLPFLHQ